MKKLIISIIILLFIACSSDKMASFYIDDPWTYSDDWYGLAELIYPGPNDAPVYDSAIIENLTLYQKGNYTYSAHDIPKAPAPSIIYDYSGRYYIFAESIRFIPSDTEETSRIPHVIEGTYSFHMEGMEMTLKKTLHPDSWPEIHTITLTKIDDGFILFGQ